MATSHGSEAGRNNFLPDRNEDIYMYFQPLEDINYHGCSNNGLKHTICQGALGHSEQCVQAEFHRHHQKSALNISLHAALDGFHMGHFLRILLQQDYTTSPSGCLHRNGHIPIRPRKVVSPRIVAISRQPRVIVEMEARPFEPLADRL